MLLPYLEHATLFDKIDKMRPWNAPENADAMTVEVRDFLNPKLPHQFRRTPSGRSVSHIAGNSQLLDDEQIKTFEDVTDGTSETLLAGEAASEFRAWGDPRNLRDPARGINRSANGFGGPWERNGAHFVLLDGSVVFLSTDIDPTVLRALATPNGGERVGNY